MRQLDVILPPERIHATPYRGVLSRWSHREAEFFDYELFACETAWTVDRNQFDDALTGLARRSGVRTADAAPSTTTFTVDACGRLGRTQVSCERGRRFDDRLVAVASSTAQPPRQEQTLLLEAIDDGWWYVVRHGAGPTWVVFLTDGPLIPTGSGARARWLERCYARTELVSAQFDVPPRWTASAGADARTACAERFAGDGWLTVGDAACSIDPLSGNGIFFALASAQRAAEAILEHLQCGSRGALENFARWCAAEYATMQLNRLATYSSVRPDLRSQPFWARRGNDRVA
jgi:hypothetical protein